MADSSYDAPPEVYNAANEVAKTIISYFRMADNAIAMNDLKAWWVYLDLIYIQTNFSFKEAERTELENLWKEINPRDKKAYGQLREYTIRLRQLCKRFFTMGDGNTGPAIFRR